MNRLNSHAPHSNSVNKLISSVYNDNYKDSIYKNKSKRKYIDFNNTDIIKEESQSIMNLSFPLSHEEDLALAIFEFGLKQSSPKLLLSLMPQYPGLNTEHIKSHLQKYRIHHERSKEEFQSYYKDYVKESFAEWASNRGWERSVPSLSASSTSDSSSHTFKSVKVDVELDGVSSALKVDEAGLCDMSVNNSIEDRQYSDNNGHSTDLQPVIDNNKSLNDTNGVNAASQSVLFDEWLNVYSRTMKECDNIMKRVKLPDSHQDL